MMDERDEFERWYCEDAALHGLTMKPNEIAELRSGNFYGVNRVALNSKWEAWQGRAMLAARGGE